MKTGRFRLCFYFLSSLIVTVEAIHVYISIIVFQFFLNETNYDSQTQCPALLFRAFQNIIANESAGKIINFVSQLVRLRQTRLLNDITILSVFILNVYLSHLSAVPVMKKVKMKMLEHKRSH